jgi:hypothetical protein
MKRLIPMSLTLVVTGFLVRGSPLCAQPSSDPVEAAVQSLGSRTRAAIAKVSQVRRRLDRALRFQNEAIRHFDVAN